MCKSSVVRNNMEGDNQTLADLLKDNGYNTGSPEFIGKLPKAVKKRVCALKKVQQQSIEVEAKFYERVHQLEKEFELEFNKLYEQVQYEPTDEESNLPIIHGIDEEDLKALNDKSEPDNGEKGVSEFWLNVLKGSDMTADMIQDHDEPILKYLVDITTSVELEPQNFCVVECQFVINYFLIKIFLVMKSNGKMEKIEEETEEGC
uniref:Nucleosome assembly protein 1-like 1 n=1 Tax=Heterorhabditis bacteriophora TaxID=37862 RepID=A0A1I7WXG4_HETBA